MTTPTPTSPWRKSSHSGDAGQCVELHRHRDALRDSKNPTTVLSGPASLASDLIAWAKTR